MIGRLKGIVDALGEDELILDVGGVGYLISAGGRTLSQLESGASVTLQIETYVREDQFRLFGFLSEAERAWFVRLQSVQGVGAKHALSILDAIGQAEVVLGRIAGMGHPLFAVSSRQLSNAPKGLAKSWPSGSRRN